MRYLILKCCLLLSFQCFSQVDDIETSNRPLDSTFMACQRGKIKYNGSTGVCVEEVLPEWDKYLNKNYQLLLKKIALHKNKEVLKKSQLAWIKYRDIEFQNIGNMAYGEGETGSFHPAVTALSYLIFVRSRALEMEAYYKGYQLKE